MFQEIDSKRSKRGSLLSTRKSIDAAKTTDANAGTQGNQNSGAQSPPKPEIISRSGRKIKPKKFLDEEEGGGMPPEANGMLIGCQS